MDIRVPSELWFDTFRHLPRDSLISIHSVSRTFYRISQPLLVRTFVFHPYMALSPYKKEGFQYRLPGEDIVKRTYRRLRFWGSDAVAPFVHECVITPWHPLERNYNDYVYCDHGDIILSSFFEILPRFTSIKTILFSCVEFTHKLLMLLSSLPNLNEIGIDRWYITPATMAQNSTHFPHVQTLSIAFMPWKEICYVASKFPAVRTLHLQPFRAAELLPASGPPQEQFFLVLESYSGPPEFLSLLDPLTRPTTLRLNAPNPRRLLEIIDRYDRAKFVTTLEVHFADLGTNPSAFWTLFGRFSILVRFQMNIRSVGGGDCDEKTFYEALAASSPFAVGITEVEINWPYGSDVAEAEIGSAAQSAKTMLVSAHPGLERIHFSSPRQAYSWIRQEDAD